MASVNFYLRSKTKQGYKLTLFLNFQKTQFFYFTGFYLEKSNWDNNKQRVRNNKENCASINKKLEILEKEACLLYEQYIAEAKELIQSEFKNHFDLITGKTRAVNDFFEFVDNFIANSYSRTTNKGETIKKGTITKYKNVFVTLKEFENYRKKPVHFQNIDSNFLKEFHTFLIKEKNFSVNNINKYIQTLKTFLNAAKQAGITIKDDYLTFRVASEKAEHVVLSREELQKLFDFDLSGNDRLNNVRDMFLIGCYTGLRFSDFSTIRPDHIEGENIRLHQYKTGGLVQIPLHPNLKSLLERRKGILPRTISSTSFNKYIKEVCQIVGIKDKVEIKQTVGGKRITRMYRKWEIISSHTARRSFATDLYLRGIPAQTIMLFTGHTTLQSFLAYIVLSPEQQANMVRSAWGE